MKLFGDENFYPKRGSGADRWFDIEADMRRTCPGGGVWTRQLVSDGDYGIRVIVVVS